MPEDEEEILVTSREGYVDTDIFTRDGDECFLESGRELCTEVIAWQPFPKPYKPEKENNKGDE